MNSKEQNAIEAKVKAERLGLNARCPACGAAAGEGSPGRRRRAAELLRAHTEARAMTDPYRCDRCKTLGAGQLRTVRRAFEELALCRDCLNDYRAEHPDAEVQDVTRALPGQMGLLPQTLAPNSALEVGS